MNAHIHAENMRLYAEDAAKTAKPWELWEFISFGMEDWQTLKSHPNWGFATEYRRIIKDPTQLDAERYRWVSDEWLDAAIDAAIAAAKEKP